VPEWALSLYGEYRRPLTPRLTGFATANWAWRDDVHYTVNADPNTWLDSYGTFGASGRCQLERRSLERPRCTHATLFDEYFSTAVFETPFDSGGYSQFPGIEGFRTVGVTLEARFLAPRCACPGRSRSNSTSPAMASSTGRSHRPAAGGDPLRPDRPTGFGNPTDPRHGAVAKGATHG
jgi:hypothetical protein